MSGMRYRDLIIVLFFIATATLLWAEPTREVQVPTKQESLAEGWSIPDFNEKVPEAPPRKPLFVSDFNQEDFELQLSVIPGPDLGSTTFDVVFSGPAGFDLMRDGGPDVPFRIVLNDKSGEKTLAVNGVEKVAANRWRFKGLALQGAAALEGQVTFRASTHLWDQNQSRFSRGARVVMIESEPVRLAFR